MVKAIKIPAVRTTKDDKTEYAADGNAYTIPEVSYLFNSKEARKAVKHLMPAAKKKAKEMLKDRGPVMVYRDIAAENFAKKGKPVAIVGLIDEDDVISYEVLKSDGTVMAVKPTEDNDKNPHELAVSAVADVIASGKYTVWNLGHDMEKWPDEVGAVVVDTVVAALEALSSKDGRTNEERMEAAGVCYEDGLEKLIEMGVDVGQFYKRFVAVVWNMMEGISAGKDVKEAEADCIARLKELEMEEHGYRFEAPVGTTFH